MPATFKTPELPVKLKRSKNSRSIEGNRKANTGMKRTSFSKLSLDDYNRLAAINMQEDEDAAVRSDVWN